MKNATILTAALIALGLVSQASAADQVVYLTGSTAFRSTVYTALNTAGTVFDASPAPVLTAAFGGSSVSGANYMLFHGNINGVPTYIDCAWSGSEAGIASAANVSILNTDPAGNPIPLAGSPETWVKADGTVSGPWTSAAPTSAQLEATSHGSDLAQADTSQAVSLTPYVANTSTALKDYGVQGIVTFTYVKNINTVPNAAWTHLTNVQTYGLRSLANGGFVPAAVFTGQAADTNKVYLIGRNIGSGTHQNFLTDLGLPTTTALQQFSIGGGVSTPSGTGLTLQYEGNDGYESGGGVAGALKIDGSCGQTDPNFGYPGWLAIGYLGIGDASSVSTPTAGNWLTENGIAESDGAIEEAQYSFWGHEHLLGKQGISGIQDTVGVKLYTGVQTTIGTAGSVPTAHSPGIALTYMHCDKSSDTAYPVHN